MVRGVPSLHRGNGTPHAISIFSSRYRSGYRGLHRRAEAETLVFVQCGAFVEFRGPFRAAAESVLGLGRVRPPRGPYLFGAGFPLRASRRYERTALASGYAVVHVRERRRRGRRLCRERVALEMVLPLRSSSGGR